MILFLAAALAAQVTLEVDATELREGQSVGVTLTVADTSVRGVPALTVPSGLQIEYRTQQQSQLIINFNRTTSTSYRYSLTALDDGDYTLGPFTVPTAAGPLATAPLKIKVVPRGASSVDSVIATIGSEIVYAGQVLAYHLRFETARSIVNGRWGAPDGPGFTTEPGIEPVTAESEMTEAGVPRAVLEVWYPLRLGRVGKVTLPGGLLRAQFAVASQRRGAMPMQGLFDDLAGFNQVKAESFSARPILLDVKPLPDSGKPPGFNGLVGHFVVETRLSGTSVAVGDTITMEVEVTGDAPLAGFSLPALDAPGVRVYDDQPVTQARIAGGRVEARALYKRAIVPEAAGTIQLPGVEIPYFNPSTGAYSVASAAPVSLSVSGSASAAAVASFAGPGGEAVGVLGEDILPVRTGASISRPLSARWSWILVLPGAIALLAPFLRRRARAVEVRRLDFPDLPSDPEGRLAGLDRIFRERVGARLGIAPDALKGEDLATLGPEAEAVWRSLERARYGGGGSVDEAALKAVIT